MTEERRATRPEARQEGGTPPEARQRLGNLGPLAAIVVCCGVELVILAALLIPTGFLIQNLVIGAVGVAAGLALLAIATDELRGAVVAAIRPARRPSRGPA